MMSGSVSEEDFKTHYIHTMSRASIMFPAFLTLASGLCSAQSDRSFPNNEAYWLIRIGELDPDFNWYTHEHELLYMHNPQIELEGRSWGTVWRGEPIGLLAVDSGKVFYRSTAEYTYSDLGWGYFDTTAQILYDFNLLVGDTAYDEQDPITVVAIDTVAIWGQEREHLVLSNDDEWIEGVGSINGLFRPFAYTWGLESVSYEMVDFCGYYIAPDSLPYQMCLPDGLDERSGPNITIGPNPCSGEFTIRAVPRDGLFTICDVRGSLIRQGRTTGTETHVALVGVPAGLYMVRVQNTWTKLVIE